MRNEKKKEKNDVTEDWTQDPLQNMETFMDLTAQPRRCFI